MLLEPLLLWVRRILLIYRSKLRCRRLRIGLTLFSPVTSPERLPRLPLLLRLLRLGRGGLRLLLRRPLEGLRRRPTLTLLWNLLE
jgi:hypothetical protein